MTVILKSFYRYFFALGLLFLSTYSTQALAELAGQVMEVEGTVIASGRTLSSGSEILSTDIIQTGDDGKITLGMIDGATIELGKNSELKISEYHYREGGEENSVLMNVVKGFFRTVSGSVGKNTADNYRVDTPLSSIGIQGTNYQVLIKDASEFIGAREGVIVVEEQDDGITSNKQVAYLGDEQEERFLRISLPVGGVRAIGAAPEWTKFSDKPEDFPAEFQW